jgi:tubulin-folding cofactor B
MIHQEDIKALKNYITSGSDYRDVHEDTLILDLTHSNLKQRHIEIRFDKHTTISSLRDKIYQKTGTWPQFQHLQFKSGQDILWEIPPGRDSERMLGYYSLYHGMSCHCIDLDPHSGSKGGQYEDTSLVEKYQISEEDYNKRKGTLRDWARQQKAKDQNFSFAKHAKEHRELMEAKRQAKLGLDLPIGFELDSDGNVVRVQEEEEEPLVDKDTHNRNNHNNNHNDNHDETTVKDIQVGMRCQVRPGDRRGTVAFVGQVPELGNGGYWVGVVFDEPVGKTDGTTKNGKKYFDTPGLGYGGFVLGKNVQVGDFPVRDIMEELDTDEEDHDNDDDDEDEI